MAIVTDTSAQARAAYSMPEPAMVYSYPLNSSAFLETGGGEFLDKMKSGGRNLGHGEVLCNEEFHGYPISPHVPWKWAGDDATD